MQNNDELTQRISVTIEALNIRIARLASALHVLLNDRSELASLMATHLVQPLDKDRRSNAGDGERIFVGFDRRQAHLREELRGLLVLRYQMATTSLHDNGLDVTRQAMVQVEAHLLRQGFEPGADGLDLDVLFNAVNCYECVVSCRRRVESHTFSEVLFRQNSSRLRHLTLDDIQVLAVVVAPEGQLECYALAVVSFSGC